MVASCMESLADLPPTDTTCRPPTRPADQPTRPDDLPTQKGRLGVCKRMQADAKGEKPMQADAKRCKRKSKEAGVKGKGARGKQG